MPELPEVEILCRGIAPLVSGLKIKQITVRRADLRWPVPTDLLHRELCGQTVLQVKRRGKYLLFLCEQGYLMVHLGMSGRLSFLSSAPAPGKHDHVDFGFAKNRILRYSDPRRFGAILWSNAPPEEHVLLASLGPEPLTEAFEGDFLFQHARKKNVSIKNFLMDSHVVAGIGNIYATEALFAAGLHPARPAGLLSPSECHQLAQCIKEILLKAIERGGTTLKDFRHEDGSLGYFQQDLQVYGRKGEGCRHCKTPLLDLRLGGRASCFCPSCQT